MKKLLLFLLLFLFSVFIALPRTIPIRFEYKNIKFEQNLKLPGINLTFKNFSFNRVLNYKLGLDLAGGSFLAFEADMEGVAQEDRQEALESVKNIIERRVNLFGVAEAIVNTSKVADSYRVSVELPGVYDTQEAVETVGKTAKLDFRESQIVEKESEGEGSATFYTKEFKSTGFTGADFKKARAGFDQQTGQPVVFFETKQESSGKFAEITKRLIEQPLAIFLDDEMLSAPVVQQEITGGSGQISGDFTIESARQLASLLNSGALPVPVKIIEQRSIEASLGAESVRASIIAGFLGFATVVLFISLYYGFLGILASASLILYVLVSLSIYKLIPVVLTLPGLAGFILSIGLAVDSNILIFERMKEELRSGNSWSDAVEAGFARAWTSIKDASIATFFIVFVLFNPLNLDFLHTSGPVRGFAATLGIGVGLSLFTGIFVTRTLLRVFGGRKELTHGLDEI